MRPLLLALLAGCGPSTGGPTPFAIAVDFDTEIATVARVSADIDGPLQIRWTGEALGETTDTRIVGLPQGAELSFTATSGGRTSDPLTVTVPDTGLPELEVLDVDPDRSEVAAGFVVAAVLATDAWSGIAVYDGLGRLVWGWRAPDHELAAAPVLGRDGRSILGFFSHRDRDIDEAVIRRFPLTGEPPTVTPVTAAHHSYVELPTGELAWMSRNFPVVDGVPLLNDTIRIAPEGAPDGGTEIFDLSDHTAPFRACTHYDERIAKYGHTGLHDWAHANSMSYDEATDTLVYGMRILDAILGIDPHTGDVLWQAGGIDADLVPDDPWDHGHFTEATADDVLLFDNGAHRQPPISRVVAYQLDPAAGTATATWSFVHPTSGYVPWLGDAHTLPGGNRLISLTTEGRLIEVSPEGDIVWDAVLPEPNIGRIRFTPQLQDLPPG